MTSTRLLRRFSLLPLAAAALALASCADDQNTPPPPTLGSTLIDRMGRAGINTALTDPFFSDANAHGAVQDSYNGASVPDQWPSLFAARIAANAAILDGLDRVCGNQLLSGPAPVAGRYATLSGVLADDRVWVNTASGACTTYLAVEANATGIIPNHDCGGRTPLYDTIDVSYSVLAAGALAGVTDGIDRDADPPASLTAFPFLAEPR